MRRRGPQEPIEIGRQTGVYGRGPQTRDAGRLALLVLGFVAVVGVGALLAVRVFGGDSCSDEKDLCPTNDAIPPPEGYEFASRVYRPNPDRPAQQQGTTAVIVMPLLKKATDSRGLSFFRYVPGTRSWEPVTTAILQEGGKGVTGTFASIPDYLAVVRRSSRAGHVVAYLPPGLGLHPDGNGRVTMIHPIAYKPAGDGKLAGELPALERDGTFQLVPVSSVTRDNGALAAAGAILSSAGTRTTHVQEIVRTVTEADLDGIDLAYLDLAVDQRTSFSLLVAELSQALHEQGKLLTLTLALPARTREGIDEGAYDWQALGEDADLIKVLPYRDQADYRITLPKLIEHVSSRVDPAKLVLTVSPYATEKSAEGLRQLTVVDAMRIATRLAIRGTGVTGKVVTESNYEIAGVNIDKVEGRTGLQWSPETATVFFTYEESGGRTVYLENVFSVGFKLEFISRYKLGGVAVEDASDSPYLGNIWPALTSFITSGQPVLLQPNSNDLAPRWNKTAGDLDGGQRGVVKWRAPATPGTYAVTLTLSDGVALFENEIVIAVEARDPRTPGPALTPSPVATPR